MVSERVAVGVMVGVGVGTVGVCVGVFDGVSLINLISVGVKVNVLVGGRIVVLGGCVDERNVGVDVGRFVGRDAAMLGGTSIPVNSNAAKPIPMNKPIDRYLISDRI